MASKHVTFSGPLFDGRAERAVRDFVRDFAENYADDVNDELQGRFDRTFKNPSGRYESQVRARRTGVGESQVGGGDVPYASWLEGTSRRNRSSSFKGYHLFRKVTRKMDRQARVQANEEFRRKYLRRMNGGI